MTPIALLGGSSAGIPGAANVKDFGAKGDGTTDDQPAIQEAVDSLGSPAGGIVFFPPGAYVQDAPVTVDPQTPVMFQGSGRGTTTLRKGSDTTLLDLSGTGTDSTGATHAAFCTVNDLTLDGTNNTAWNEPLMRLYYANNICLDRLYFKFNFGEAIRAVEWWDSWVNDCAIVECGGRSGDRPAVNIRRNDGTVGNFGYSTDNNNMITFRGCRWESFRDGAIWVVQGTGNTGENGAVRLVDGCKFESYKYRGNVAFVQVCRGFTLRDFYTLLGTYDTGYSGTTDDAFYLVSTLDSHIENGLVYHAAAVNRHLFHLDGGNFGCSLHHITARASADITGALVAFSGVDNSCDVQDVRFTENVGSSPVFQGSPSRPIHQFGAGAPEGVVTAVVGSTYMRTDGAASTTLYVKTSGTGNTGWTAK